MTTRANDRVSPRILVGIVLVTMPLLIGRPGSAASITASYDVGRTNVTINGYGTSGMGTFRLTDGADDHIALCIEADVSHTTTPDAYDPSGNRVASPELDVLLWWLSRQSVIDDDTAVAAAALAWYYAGARRSIGPLVWSDGSRDFAPVTPVAPEPWDALPRFTLSHMIGLTSGAEHLDAAERRVAELHALATAWATPWTIRADADGRTFVLHSGRLPLAGVAVDLTIDQPGADPVRRRVVSDAAGRIDGDLPALPDGATVTAAVDSPGIHREWDGAGDVQRMATATNRRIVAAFDVAPMPRFVEVRKTTTDPTIGVAGAEFELADAGGDRIATVSTNDRGHAAVGPIDPDRHPAPYRLTELAAPPGLVRSPTPVTISTASHDPHRPSVVTVVNEAATVDLVVRKVTSIATVGPPDRSDFRFTVTRRADGRQAVAVTGRDGRTAAVPLPLGVYTICETATPDWAVGLIDGGCVETEVDAGLLTAAADHGTAVVVEYRNLVPEPSIDTHVRDARDDDRTLPTSGGVAVDRVELADLVPGTEYVLTGALVAVPASGEPERLGVGAETTFVARDARTVVELSFEVPPTNPGRIVIIESLSIGGRVVAEHADLDDPDQTLEIVAPPTTTTTTTTTTSTTTTTTTAITTTVATTTTTPAPATTTITTITMPAATTSSTTPPPVGTSTIAPPTVPTLPVTGPSDAGATALRVGDVGFVMGVALVAAASWMPRRPGRDEAGCRAPRFVERSGGRT